MSDDLRQTDIDAITEGIPPGRRLTAVRAETIPARTWTELGFDDLEIYFTTGQDVRFLVRKVVAADHSPT